MASRDVVRLKTFSGEYVAKVESVRTLMAMASRREMINEIANLWPELWGWRDGVRLPWKQLSDEQMRWREWINSSPAFVLAIVLMQE